MSTKLATRPKEKELLGSVSKRAEDKWLAQLPPSMGRRGKIHDSEEHAYQWLREENAKSILGITPANVEKRPVGDLIKVWHDGNTLKDTTRMDYEIRINTHMLPTPLAKMPIGQARGMHVDEAILLTPENWTRIHVAKLWKGFADWAENNQLTTGNIYRQSGAKRICQIQYRMLERKETSDNTWTPEQFIAFLEHEPDDVYRTYYCFVAATGARRGEAIGLSWPNVHSGEGWCWLQDNITTAGGKVFNAKTPKNYKRRKAYFGSIIGEMLEVRRTEQNLYKVQFGDQWDPDQWVFDRRRGKGQYFHPGVHLAPATVTERFNRHTRQLGLPDIDGPHGLRRTWATLAEDEGFKSSVRRDSLGHTPKDVTERYSKTTPTELAAAAEHITKLLLGRPLRV